MRTIVACRSLMARTQVDESECGRLSAIHYGGYPRALVSQLAEETDSKPVQCEFESHRGHHRERAMARFQRDTPLSFTIWSGKLSRRVGSSST